MGKVRKGAAGAEESRDSKRMRFSPLHVVRYISLKGVVPSCIGSNPGSNTNLRLEAKSSSAIEIKVAFHT
jgi:hypothetical protein